MLRHRPALRVVVLLVGGIFLSEVLPLSWPVLLGALAAVFLVQLFLFFFSPRSLRTQVLFHVSVVVLSAAWASYRTEEVRRHRFEPDHPAAIIRLDAFLEEQPVKQGSSCKLVMQSDSVVLEGIQRSGGRFLGFLPWKKAAELHALKVGTSMTVWGTLQEFPRPRNPGEFDYGRYLGLKDIHGIVQIDSARAGLLSGTVSFRSWFAKLRSDFGSILARYHGAEQAAFLQGVLFGDRKDIPAELKESFMNTGTIHILAVSGSNVATIALMVYLILGLLRFPKRWVVGLTVTGLFFYMMLTGAESSIVRATIMGCVIVVGTAMERRTDIYNSICVAAVIVLLIDPLQLYDVGFQLSFAAVLSIVMLYPVLDAAIRNIPQSLEEFKILEPVWQVFAVSLAAQLGTLPFTAYYFERFSIVSLLANVIVVPLVGLNLVLGCMTIAAHFVGAWFAATYSALNEFLVDVLLGFVRYAAGVPFAAVETYGFGILAGAAYYAVLIGVMNMRNPPIVKVAALCLGVFATIAVYRDAGERKETLRVFMLDVGQGDAVLIRFPNGSNMLVDAGPRAFGYDAGKRVLVPFLARNTITRIDAILLSHPHSDHIGGVEAVLTSVNVGVILEADTLTASRMHSDLRSAAEDRGVPVHRVGAGANVSPDANARLYVLHPVPGQDHFDNLNNSSLVLKMMYGDATALFVGDAEVEAEEIMKARYGSFLDGDLLKTGHHGSSTSSSEHFLDGITPKIAIISVGARNKFKHPSPQVIQRLQENGTTVFRTDLEGALIFETDGTEWKRIHWR